MGSDGSSSEDIPSDLVLQLHQLTDGPGFRWAQAAYALVLVSLVDGGFSGDWSKYGLISSSTEATLQQTVYAVAAVHVAMAGASAYVASTKGANPATAFAGGIATGAMELMRNLGLMDDKEKAAVQKNKNTNDEKKMPPLQMEISSLDINSRLSPTGVMLSTSIRSLPGQELEMRTLLETLTAETKADQSSRVFTMAVNQDPDDRQNFFMLQRFPSVQAMSGHQTSAVFKAFTSKAESLIEEPMGLYLVNERSGRFTEPCYPFGPSGEGGRDDAVYSSPANLQGSQARGMVSTEKFHANKH